MSKPRSFYGQLNFTKLKEALKSGKVKGERIQTKHGEQIVFDVNVWVNEQPDKYNNDASVQMSLTKEAYEAKEPNPYYIGNLRYKTPTSQEATPEELAKAVNDVEDDDLPF